MKKTQKILSIVALCIVGLFAITAILLAIIPMDFNKNVVPDNAIGITVRVSNKEQTFTKEETEYKKIYSLYNESHKNSLLTSLFQGAFGNDTEVTSNDFVSNLSSLRNSGTTIEFSFGTGASRELKIGGKEQKTSGNTITFDSLLLVIKDSKNLQSYNIYLIRDGNCRCTVTSYAKLNKLYNYLNDLELTTMN